MVDTRDNEMLQPARDAFLARYYAWSLEESRKEFNQDFPFLRSIHNAPVFRFLEAVTALNRTEQTVLSTALVKRFNERGMEVAGDTLTREEAHYIDGYVGRSHREDERFRAFSSPSRKEQELNLLEEKGAIHYGFDTPKLRSVLLGRLVPIIGDVEGKWDHPTNWRHATSIGPWRVQTYVAISEAHAQLRYSHSISSSEDARLSEHESILKWLGIVSQTYWDTLTDEEALKAAKSMELICRHFMNAVPTLLEDLTPRNGEDRNPPASLGIG